jgi:competence protein ComEC
MPSAIAFLLGVLLLQLSPELPPLPWLLSGLLLGLLLVLLARRLLWRWLPLPSLLLLGFCYAALHASWGLSQQLPQRYASIDLLATGRVLSLPVEQERRSRFEFQLESLQQGEELIPFQAKIRLSWYDKDRPELRAGELWQLQVRLKRPHGFANPAGFDYQSWLWQQGIRATGYVRRSELNQRLGPGSAWPPWLSGRQQLAERLQAALAPEAGPAAVLLAALTLGERTGFSPEQWQVFRQTGTNHLVAISGLHVGMVAGLLLLLCSWLWRRSAWLCLRLAAPRAGALAALLGATFYAAMAGFSIPTQRALIMLMALLLPLLLGRQQRPWQGLGLALILVLLLDPKAVLAPGFILSFAAVAAILWALALRSTDQSRLWSLLRMQFAVLLAISPLLILLFNQASLLAFPVNLLAVPWFSLVLVPLAFIAVLLLMLAPPLGAWLLQQIAPLYSLSLDALHWAAERGPGLWELAERPVWVILCACIGSLWLLSPLRLPAAYLGLLLLWPLLAWRPDRPDPGQFEVTMLDVGQGLAVLVQTAQHSLLYDTGAAFSPTFNAGSAVVAPYLIHRGIRRLDRLLISHGARDHAGGLAPVLAQFQVDRLMAPPSLATEGLEATPCQAGQSWRWDGVDFRLLHPQPDAHWSANDSSCVLWIGSDNSRFLLVGDLERAGEQALLARHADLLQGAVIQVGHHGSRTSSSPAWVQALASPLALISSGYQNPLAFPPPRWCSAGANPAPRC